MSNYIVIKAGRPQSLVNIGLGLRAGVLMPTDRATVFATRRRARRAITRTERAASRLRNSMLSDFPKIAPLLAADPYTVVPLEVGPQNEGDQP